MAQQIVGATTSVRGEALNAVIIILRETNEGTPVAFTISEGGRYAIKLDKNYAQLFVEASLQGYFNSTQSLYKLEKDKVYTLDFFLESDTVRQLDEVIIRTKRIPYVIKGDTTTFHVASFKDGSERKIEDLLKKLPGVQVNEASGEIKYRGSSIETVLLDGDNLFDYNYSIGTKNINVDMVDEVEAFDNYSKNPLLKGLEGKDRVALNLRLKKGKTDLSGNAETGIGSSTNGKWQMDINGNVLTTAKKFKSFGVLAFNNIGENRTPYDYFSFSQSVEQIKSAEVLADRIIPDTRFNSFINEKRISINKQYFGNYNSIWNISKKLSIKTNVYYIQDQISNTQTYVSNNIIQQVEFTTTDRAKIARNPLLYRFDGGIYYQPNPKNRLEYLFRIYQEEITTHSDVLQNNTKAIISDLVSRNTFQSHQLNWTKRINQNLALQISLQRAQDNIGQTLLLTPSFYNSTDQSLQTVDNHKTFTDLKTTLLTSGTQTKRAFSLGYTEEEIPLLSDQFTIQSGQQKAVNATNDVRYKLNNLFVNVRSERNIKKWSILLGGNTKYISQDFDYLDNRRNEKQLFLEGNLLTRYKVNSSTISWSVGYQQKPLAAKYLFGNPILLDNRTSVTNSLDLSFQKNTRLSVGYHKEDLDKQFYFDFILSHQIMDGNYFTYYSVEQNKTNLQYFFRSKQNQISTADVEISKYVSGVESNVKLIMSLLAMNYNNIVNLSDLRNNQSILYQVTLFNKSAYSGFFNCENTFQVSGSANKTSTASAITNTSINNTLKLIAKPSKDWFALWSYNYFMPDVNSSRTYNLFDATVRYRPLGKKYELSLIFRNILNENNFLQVQTSDFATNIYYTNLIPRYILVNVLLTL